MTRKKKDFTRVILPDPKYNDLILAKAVNVIMKHGKKSITEKAIYDALDIVEEKTKEKPIAIFHKALKNIQPDVEVRSRRVGGANYQVPTEVNQKRAQALALRWLKTATRARSEKTLATRFAGELLDAIENRGAAVKKREDTHRMAEANKAFAHFRW